MRSVALTAVIASMVVVNLVYGLTLPLLSLVLDAQGVSRTLIGVSILVQAAGGVLLAKWMPALILRVGPAAIMQRSTLAAAVLLLLLGVFQNVWLWLPLRFALGASAALLWSASEVLVNELAEEQWRGRIVGAYGAAGAAGFAIGPLVLIATGSDGLLPFAVGAAIVALAGLPLLRLRDPASDGATDSAGDGVSLRRIFAAVPHIMLLNLMYAAAVEAFIAFFPLFGIDIGLGEARSLSLITMFALGGVVLQLPLGWLADHVPRYGLLLSCVVFTLAGFALLPEVVSLGAAGAAYVFTLGGIEGMIYSLGVILLGQRYRGAELAAASVLFTGMWGVGTMIGPAFVGAGMDVFGATALPYLLALIYAAYLPVYFLSRRREV